MADWSSEKTLDFFEEYRKYTVFWHSLDKNYKKKIWKKKEVLFRS